MKSTKEFLIKTNKNLYFLLLDNSRFEEISEWLAETIYTQGKKGLKTKIGTIWNVEVQHYQNQVGEVNRIE